MFMIAIRQMAAALSGETGFAEPIDNAGVFISTRYKCLHSFSDSLTKLRRREKCY